jgi:2-polyprenyl-3-methyl-5-hydroxy-6-metoxy-1,4-benzoquinol methylase
MQLVDRDCELINLARGKRVLHLGAVGFTDFLPEDRAQNAPSTLHWKLTQVADVTGIDYSREVIDAYHRDGIFDNVIYGNVENLSDVEIDGTFDVVIAADIIEHLSNPGLMLEGIKQFCRNGVEVVITTPNAFGVANFLRFAAGTFREGAEHVMTFNVYNLCQILKRHGFTVERIDTCYQQHAAKKRLFPLMRAMLKRIPAFGGTLFVVSHF